LEDWIEEVKKCTDDLLMNGNWKERDICIILTNGDTNDSFKYLKFYLKLKSRYSIV
jgi:hypothetical protein